MLKNFLKHLLRYTNMPLILPLMLWKRYRPVQEPGFHCYFRAIRNDMKSTWRDWNRVLALFFASAGLNQKSLVFQFINTWLKLLSVASYSVLRPRSSTFCYDSYCLLHGYMYHLLWMMVFTGSPWLINNGNASYFNGRSCNFWSVFLWMGKKLWQMEMTN